MLSSPKLVGVGCNYIINRRIYYIFFRGKCPIFRRKWCNTENKPTINVKSLVINNIIKNNLNKIFIVNGADYNCGDRQFISLTTINKKDCLDHIKEFVDDNFPNKDS